MAFQRALAWNFRWWFAGLPGGVGLATAKACLKLWIGFHKESWRFSKLSHSRISRGEPFPLSLSRRLPMLGAWRIE
jgi:hypothetical protein